MPRKIPSIIILSIRNFITAFSSRLININTVYQEEITFLYIIIQIREKMFKLKLYQNVNDSFCILLSWWKLIPLLSHTKKNKFFNDEETIYLFLLCTLWIVFFDFLKILSKKCVCVSEISCYTTAQPSWFMRVRCLKQRAIKGICII